MTGFYRVDIEWIAKDQLFVHGYLLYYTSISVCSFYYEQTTL